MKANLSEVLTALHTTTAKSESFKSSLDALQLLLGPNIRIRYETINDAPLTSTVQRRLILTTTKASANFSCELVRQCNGVVIDYPSWELLAVPPNMFSPRYSINNIISNFSKYSIYDVNDGTTVTLY